MKSRSKSNRKLEGGCLSLFGMPFLLAGLAMSWVYFSGYADWLRALNWRETPCRIESAELKTSRGGDTDTYEVVASYRYHFDGREYHGMQVGLGSGSDNIGDYQQRIHRELLAFVSKNREAEENFRCFVNPSNPSQAVIYRELRWPMQAFRAIFALTFPAVGAGLVAGGWINARNLRRNAKLQAQSPGEPWKSDPKWQSSTIADSSVSRQIALHLYTLWSGAIVFTLMGATALTGAYGREPRSALLAIFVILWCIPAFFSLRWFRGWLAIGKVAFEMSPLPAVPGGMATGALVMQKPLPPRASGAEITLSCSKKTVSSGADGDVTSSEKIWSHTETVPQDRITRDLSGFRIPVSISLPADAPESGTRGDPEREHEWKLELRVPGTPVRCVFGLPVFHTGEIPADSQSRPVGATSIHDETQANLASLLAAHRIQAEFDHLGRPVCLFTPPARNRGTIVGMFVFNLIWTGAAVWLVSSDAPQVFQIVWPASSIVIWLTLVYWILHQRRVSFREDQMEVTTRLGPIAKTVTWDKGRIACFSHDSNMVQNGVSFYRVRAELTDGRRITLVNSIPESFVVEALVQRLTVWKNA